jgi:hypothetical protein
VDQPGRRAVVAVALGEDHRRDLRRLAGEAPGLVPQRAASGLLQFLPAQPGRRVVRPEPQREGWATLVFTWVLTRPFPSFVMATGVGKSWQGLRRISDWIIEADE